MTAQSEHHSNNKKNNDFKWTKIHNLYFFNPWIHNNTSPQKNLQVIFEDY